MSKLPAIPAHAEMQSLKEICGAAIASRLLPESIKTPEAALIIALKGRELGIPPLQAFSGIAVINGKPTLSAELMLALIYKNVPGASVAFLKTTNEECAIESKRPLGKPSTFVFTMEDAQRAGLWGRGPWKTYPAAMLRARCTSSMARAMFPDALAGASYTAEELGAEVDGEGNVLSLPEMNADIAQPEEAEQDIAREVAVEELLRKFRGVLVTEGMIRQRYAINTDRPMTDLTDEQMAELRKIGPEIANKRKGVSDFFKPMGVFKSAKS